MAVLLLWRSILVAVIVVASWSRRSGLLPDAVTQRVDETSQKSKSGEEEVDASTSSRWSLGGRHGHAQGQPIGVGLHRFPRYIGPTRHAQGVRRHNFYVLTLCEAGPQGLLTLLFLCSRSSSWRATCAHAPAGGPEARALTVGFTIASVIACSAPSTAAPRWRGA